MRVFRNTRRANADIQTCLYQNFILQSEQTIGNRTADLAQPQLKLIAQIQS